jgi:hypothetical protein
MASSLSKINLGQFEDQTDIGPVKRPGMCDYEVAEQVYSITGAGANIRGEQDAFHFVWKIMRGNFIVTMRAEFTIRTTSLDGWHGAAWRTIRRM